MEKQTARAWLAGSLGVAAFVVLSIRFIDRPVARFMDTLALFHHVFTLTPFTFPVLILMAGLAILLAILHKISGKPMPRWMMAATIAALALLISVAVTESGLKYVFGRTGPSAYLRHGEYGFHWFHRGERYKSFPSGHTDQAMAILSVLWALYPRWRWAYVASVCALSFALLAGQWHFLSDIVAGGYVGTVVGMAALWLWNTVLGDHLSHSDTDLPPR